MIRFRRPAGRTQSAQARLTKHKAEQQKAELERRKLEIEYRKLRADHRWHWRAAPLLAPLVTAGLVVAGLASILNLYGKDQNDKFGALLRDLGADEPRTRVAAIARLPVYSARSTWIGDVASALFGGASDEDRAAQIAQTLLSVLWLEDDVYIKQLILQTLEEQHRDAALAGLLALRPRILVYLKNETTDRPEHWLNLKDTLVRVALSLSALTGEPPDLRCFPLAQIRFRQMGFPPDADFRYASLSYAEFWGGSFQRALFDGSNLHQATLRFVDLSGASFYEADLQGARFGPQALGLDAGQFAGSSWPAADWSRQPELGARLAGVSAGDLDAAQSAAVREGACRPILLEYAKEGG